MRRDVDHEEKRSLRQDMEEVSRPKEAIVALRAEDEGSSIGAIYYRLQGEQQLRLYESPFTVPINTAIFYGAVDKVGNASPLQKLLVDDAPNSLATTAYLSGLYVRLTAGP